MFVSGASTVAAIDGESPDSIQSSMACYEPMKMLINTDWNAELPLKIENQKFDLCSRHVQDCFLIFSGPHVNRAHVNE